MGKLTDFLMADTSRGVLALIALDRHAAAAMAILLIISGPYSVSSGKA